jgi:hypothetical protein
LRDSKQISIMNFLNILLIFLAFSCGIQTKKLYSRDYEEIEYTNNQESDYTNTQDEDYDNGDDITCSSAANMSSQFNENGLDDKILTILKLGPNINLMELTM